MLLLYTVVGDPLVPQLTTVFSQSDAAASILFSAGEGEATIQERPLFKSGAC